MQWVKGQSPNAGGRPKTKLFRQAFLNCLSFSEVEKVAKSIVAKAQDGDLDAAEFVRDTVDGKPKQEIDISDERSSNNLAERLEQILASAAGQADAVHTAKRESGTGRVN